ncbi:hypothetical protein FM104_05495 [Microbacterium esteraromaticum]|uniref:Uncharacterized protein n=1 Tax=Microbacterium esteraromaticum TaxID=57043 RepID=A0A1R4J5C2_9MICO|nr:hypothetical protein [Microbacterium esteraromaticum]SJN27286.1 hypothetical protein FM104_05495 [Microbacterium esteraromaticum]
MSAEHGAAPFHDGASDAAWGDAGLFDPFSADSFGQEIANVDASDWNVDADLLWGDDAPGDFDAGDVPPAPDFFG